jgi:hypothetical protein
MCQLPRQPVPVREELHLVTAWRRFLIDPGSYFRHMQVG